MLAPEDSQDDISGDREALSQALNCPLLWLLLFEESEK